jgi:uncharacterized membrane-anchored protein YitT (DUF2179 family)
MSFFSGITYKKGDFKIINFIALTIAGIINAVGVTLLLAPVNLYDSGASGLAMFLDMLLEQVPLFVWIIIINFPIFLFGLKKQGLAFTVYSLYSIVIYSVAAAIFQNVIPQFDPEFLAAGEGSPIAGNEIILCCIFGGMLSGIGSGITIRYGGTMDGIETLAVIFSKKLGLTVGNFVMIFNVILYLTIGITVIATGTGDFTIPLFSIIAYFVNGKAVDFISEGIDQAKGALIITTEYDAVAPALSEEFGRGLTIIDAKGFYSNSEKKVIYCVVNRFQLSRVRAVVARCDKHAFVTVMDITDVFGTSVKNSRAYEKKRAKQIKQSKKLAAELAVLDEAKDQVAKSVAEEELAQSQQEAENTAEVNIQAQNDGETNIPPTLVENLSPIDNADDKNTKSEK